MNPLGRTRRAARALAALAGGAALAFVLAAAGCGRPAAPTLPAGAPAAATGTPVPASAITRLTTIAHRAATFNGDPDPVWITAVLTTRAEALTSATPGDSVPGSAHVKVYLITMRGHFIAKISTRPAGAKTPTGRYLSLVLDAKTFRALDTGLSPKAPPVWPASLGPVTHLTDRAM